MRDLSIEVVIGIITIVLILYISKNVLNIDITAKPKSQINSFAENVHIVRLTGNATQIVNASFVSYIGPTVFAKDVFLKNIGKNDFTIRSNKVYIYKNNNLNLIGDIVAKGKNFIAKTNRAYWDNANTTLSSNENSILESPKVNVKKSNGFIYNKKTNTLVVYKADVWLQ